MAYELISEYIYDNLVGKLLQAGADLNYAAPNGRRPIQIAVNAGNAALVERLIRDGAQVDFPIQNACPGKSTNLHGYLVGLAKPRDPPRIAKIVGLLNAAGLPANKPVTAVTGIGFTYCRNTTIHDEALNVGNLEFAKMIKAAIENTKLPERSGRQRDSMDRHAVSPIPDGKKVDARESAGTSRSFGNWQVTSSNNGRPLALAVAIDAGGDVAQLRIECVTGGRLEYVPVGAKGQAIRSLWIEGADEPRSEIRLNNGRASGAVAARLSREFLAVEAEATKAGAGDQWAMRVVVNDVDRPASTIKAAGFGKMRAQMLQLCKN